MGVVYLAREVSLDRPVAIKLLPPGLAADPGLRDRFLREARTAAQLSHPNIVAIHAVDDAGGFVYFVMAFIDGDTLGDRVRRQGPLPPHEAAPKEAATEVVRGAEVILPLAGLVDFAAERARLAKDQDKLRKEADGLTAKLQNPGFRGKAPADVIAKGEARLVELRGDLERLQATLARLGG